MNKRIVDILTPAATPIALESAQRQLEKFELQIDVAANRDSFPSQIKQIYNEAVSFADKVIFSQRFITRRRESFPIR
jgi:hypothetical protein